VTDSDLKRSSDWSGENDDPISAAIRKVYPTHLHFILAKVARQTAQGIAVVLTELQKDIMNAVMAAERFNGDRQIRPLPRNPREADPRGRRQRLDTNRTPNAKGRGRR
jgi:hypothetical protein